MNAVMFYPFYRGTYQKYKWRDGVCLFMQICLIAKIFKNLWNYIRFEFQNKLRKKFYRNVLYFNKLCKGY